MPKLTRTNFNPNANLFEKGGQDEARSLAEMRSRPLAERMRPHSLDDFIGQEKLVGPGRALRRMIEDDRLQSMMLWGPPGTGDRKSVV